MGITFTAFRAVPLAHAQRAMATPLRSRIVGGAVDGVGPFVFLRIVFAGEA